MADTLPSACKVVLDPRSWPRPEIFSWLQRDGGVADAEMHRTFNCGIGFVVIVAAADADRASALLEAQGQTAFRIGRVEARQGDEAATQLI